MKGVYKLYVIETGVIFYIGRSTDTERRKLEHIRNAANGDNELKYCMIREFTANNTQWDLEVIDSDMDSEDYHCYLALLNGEPLRNMCKGSVYTEIQNSARYNSLKEYNAGVIHREEQRVAKALSLQAYTSKRPSKQQPGESAVLGSTKPPTTISGGLAAIRARRGK